MLRLEPEQRSLRSLENKAASEVKSTMNCVKAHPRSLQGVAQVFMCGSTFSSMSILLLSCPYFDLDAR